MKKQRLEADATAGLRSPEVFVDFSKVHCNKLAFPFTQT
jgi:hypothetical protein